MPETSAEFGTLEFSLAEADGLLDGLPLHDVSTRRQDLQLRSYVILCHAAIEEYLERVSLRVLIESLAAFKCDGLLRDPLISVICYYQTDINATLSNRKVGDREHDLLLGVLTGAINQHTSALMGMHGIKTRNQEAIFLPIGVSLFAYDRILSQNLNSFGGVRGSFAHSFGAKSITPKSGQQKNVKNLLRLLQSFDNMLCDRFSFSYQKSAYPLTPPSPPKPP